MTDPTNDAVLQAAGARLSVWITRLRRELDQALAAAEEGDDKEAEDFLKILGAVQERLETAFARYITSSEAPGGERLKWLQQVGSGLALVVSYLGLLDHSTQPRKAPLAAAYMRMLDTLTGGERAILLPVRFFNYELIEVHSDKFINLLLEDVDRFDWPILFLRMPAGLLDSPRNHVLVGHELGHAVAAKRREAILRHARIATRARRTGAEVPPAPEPLYGLPETPHQQLLEVSRRLWAELGRPPIEPPPAGGQFTVEHLLFLEHHAEVVQRFQQVVEAWLEEIFADAIGLNLFGPAFLLGSLYVFLPTGEFNRPTDDHPPTGMRILLQMQALKTGSAGDRTAALPQHVASTITAIVTG